MITFFALPKAFHGHVGLIQRNAIASWCALPGVEVLLLGEEDGLAEVARELGARHLPEIRRTSLGTPLVSDAFVRAVAAAHHPRLCYVNADIILLGDILGADIPFPRYLAVGQRTDLDQREPVDVDAADWQERLRRDVAARGRPHALHAIDYFLFPRAAGVEHMPPFAVGRPGWDNWVLRETRRRHLPLVDASAVITAIHQDHDYAHVPGGDSKTYEGPEARDNRRMMGGDVVPYDILDASHVATPSGVRRAWSEAHLRRRRERWVEARPWLARPMRAATAAYKLAAPLLRAVGVARRSRT